MSTSNSDFDLTTADGMRQFLSTVLPHNISAPLELLSGGSSKYIFRVCFEQPSQPSVIAIHASQFSAGHPGFRLPQSRLKTEFMLSQVLSAPSTGFGPVRVDLDGGLTVGVPTTYQYFEDHAVMIVEDVKDSITLKAALIDTHTRSSLSALKAGAIGSSLGQFASELHNLGRSADNKSALQLRADWDENVEAKEISFTVFYDWLMKAANEIQTGSLATEEMKELIEKVKDFMREEMFEKRDSWTIVHGDFWTGNVLVPCDLVEPTRQDVKHKLEKKINIVDWELCKLAPPHFDLGQMVAELYLPYHFYENENGIQMIEGFLRSYTANIPNETGNPSSQLGEYEEGKVDLAFKSMMHFGGHLVTWPRITGWPDEGGKIESVIELGAEYLRKGWERDVDFLMDSIFKALVMK
ncbi:hypothetical protein BJ508DRAFT_417326 [Ascobolus immersus RN42]|uniref:Aminoglycoside phosphotransferase domain-containing protein n=1 Tax=Ascobolus immersus RN42 TaxID=1160509 RepID=A0A3N4HT25_ASCIM|nr:hypothetical protein BJ508DRAFT_417326 [Ascobolus immersus RN42]